MGKKKPKKYPSPKEDIPPQAKEPLVAYGLPAYSYMDSLASLTVKDVHKIQLPGNVLLDIQLETDLNASEIAGVLGISKSKYYELIKLNILDPREVDVLADFAGLWQKGLEAFDGDRELLHEWLNTRNENLGGVLPITLLPSRVGLRTLEKAFLRIEYSIYG